METQQLPENETTRPPLSAAWLAAGAIAVLVLGLLAYGLVSRPTSALQAGSPAPEFELTALDGSSISLTELQGKVVVVNFFASWCAPCRLEAADLEAAWRSYEGQGVQFYGIAYRDAASKAQAFLDEFQVSYPSAVEPDNRTARAYGITGVPETYVIDQQGMLVHHFIGTVTQEELRRVIDPLLSDLH